MIVDEPLAISPNGDTFLEMLAFEVDGGIKTPRDMTGLTPVSLNFYLEEGDPPLVSFTGPENGITEVWQESYAVTILSNAAKTISDAMKRGRWSAVFNDGSDDIVISTGPFRFYGERP